MDYQSKYIQIMGHHLDQHHQFNFLLSCLIDLGIMPVFSYPAHPEQNGRHERMHRDLKAECVSPAAFDMRSQQRKLNSFVREYNNIRPHEALNMETPQKVHVISSIPFPEEIRPYDYPAHMKVMNVTRNGSVRWISYYWVFITNGLIGKQVGTEEIGNGIWKVFYRDVFLGYFNENGMRVKEKSVRLSHNLV